MPLLFPPADPVLREILQLQSETPHNDLRLQHDYAATIVSLIQNVIQTVVDKHADENRADFIELYEDFVQCAQKHNANSTFALALRSKSLHDFYLTLKARGVQKYRATRCVFTRYLNNDCPRRSTKPTERALDHGLYCNAHYKWLTRDIAKWCNSGELDRLAHLLTPPSIALSASPPIPLALVQRPAAAATVSTPTATADDSVWGTAEGDEDYAHRLQQVETESAVAGVALEQLFAFTDGVNTIPLVLASTDFALPDDVFQQPASVQVSGKRSAVYGASVSAKVPRGETKGLTEGTSSCYSYIANIDRQLGHILSLCTKLRSVSLRLVHRNYGCV